MYNAVCRKEGKAIQGKIVKQEVEGGKKEKSRKKEKDKTKENLQYATKIILWCTKTTLKETLCFSDVQKIKKYFPVGEKINLLQISKNNEID